MDWIESHIKTLTTLSGMDEQTARKLFLQPVRVELEQSLTSNRTYRLAYLVAINLIARIFPRVDFVSMPSAPDAITPWGIFEPRYYDGQPPSAVLRIGGKDRSNSNEICLRVHDWQVVLDSADDGDPSEKWNPILAVIGASYGASALTNKLLRGAVSGTESWPTFSVLDFSSATAEFDFDAPIEIGEIHVAGVGAIGSAFLFCLLAHGKCKGRMHLLDKDTIDSTNLGRYPLFDISEIDEKKVEAAQKRLEVVSGLDVVSHMELFQQYCHQQLTLDRNFRINGLISAPDKRETRRQFQHELPRQTWDASTGPDQVVIHHNTFDPELACLECIYPQRPEEDAHLRHVSETLGVPLERMKAHASINMESARLIVERYPHLRVENVIGRDFDSIFRDLCSASTLKAGDEVVLAPMSFTSMLAGAFQYLEFLKALRPETFAHLKAANYYTLNPHFPPNPYLRELRTASQKCSCQSPAFRKAFNRIWKLN